MALAETRPPNPRGEALVAELKWVHDMIRRDLTTVRQMAADVQAGLPAEEVGSAIRTLAANGPLWQLRVNCLRYCHFVHSHHHAESILLFPELRRADPALNPVVDKLEADHAHVSDLLDDVERGGARPQRRGEPGRAAAAGSGSGNVERRPPGSSPVRGGTDLPRTAHLDRLATLVRHPPSTSGDPGTPQAPAREAMNTDEYACARAWAALSAAHARVADRLSSELTRSFGLSINDFEVLLRLDRTPPPGLRLGELNSAVRLTQPSLSRAVTRLESRGWLRRAGAPEDGRGVLVSISPEGRDVLSRAAVIHAQAIRELLLDRLTPGEQDLLARALTRIAED